MAAIFPDLAKKGNSLEVRVSGGGHPASEDTTRSCLASAVYDIFAKFAVERGAATSDPLPAEVLKISAEAPEPRTVHYAASLIQRGLVVAIPTDTFYGLSADPYNLAAVGEVFRVKGRVETKALPILVNSIEQAVTLVRDLPDNFLVLAHRFWPGALTIVVESTHRLPLKVTGNSGRVALRWPNAVIACDLIEAVGGPVTGTSANLSGFPACSDAVQLVKQMGDRLPLILDGGDTGARLPSTIIALHGADWAIIREGAIAEEDIRNAIEN